MLSWLFDIKTDVRGLRFIIFGFWEIYLLEFENIEFVKEIGFLSLGSLNAFNFKNRLLARSFLIQTRQGWFTHKVLVTPERPEDFLTWLKKHDVTTVDG